MLLTSVSVQFLRRMNKLKEVLITIKKRKILYIGHIMRGERYELFRLKIKGKYRERYRLEASELMAERPKETVRAHIDRHL